MAEMAEMAEIDRLLGGYVRERTPATTPDFAEVTARARRRARTRSASVVAGAIAVIAAGTAVVIGVQPGGSAPSIVAITSPTRTPTAVKALPSPVRSGQRSGPIADGGNYSCVDTYSPQVVAAHTSFAFDGTVTRIGPVHDGLIGSSQDTWKVVAVTFTVNGWFRGGTSTELTGEMLPPGVWSSVGDPSYRIGTRLLVSGEWGGPSGRDAKLTTACGYTRYYDAQTSAAWARAMRQS